MARKIKPRHLARREEETRKVRKTPRFNQRVFSDNNNFMYPLNNSPDGIRDALTFGCTRITRSIIEGATESSVEITIEVSVLSATEDFSAFINECSNALAEQNQLAALGGFNPQHAALFLYEGTVYQVINITVNEDALNSLNSVRRAQRRNNENPEIITVEGVALPDIIKLKRGT